MRTLTKTIKCRSGSGILIFTLILCFIIATIGYSMSQLTGVTFASLETSAVAIQAQQLAKSRGDEVAAMQYSNIPTLAPETRQLINNTGLYRQTTVNEEITNSDSSKTIPVIIDIFRNTTDSNSIYTLQISASNKATTQGVPTGTIIWFASNIPPPGFIICNGQSTAVYPELAKIVGSTVPDLRGEFIRGLDLGRGLDEETLRSVRSIQSAGLPNILGSVGVFITDVRFRSNSGALNITRNGGWLNVPSGGVASEDSISFDASKSNILYGSSNTVRPRNIALLPCIKT